MAIGSDILSYDSIDVKELSDEELTYELLVRPDLQNLSLEEGRKYLEREWITGPGRVKEATSVSCEMVRETLDEFQKVISHLKRELQRFPNDTKTRRMVGSRGVHWLKRLARLDRGLTTEMPELRDAYENWSNWLKENLSPPTLVDTEGAKALPPGETHNNTRAPIDSSYGTLDAVPLNTIRTSTPIPRGRSHITGTTGTIPKTTFPFTSYSGLISSNAHTDRTGGPRKVDFLQQVRSNREDLFDAGRFKATPQRVTNVEELSVDHKVEHPSSWGFLASSGGNSQPPSSRPGEANNVSRSCEKVVFATRSSPQETVVGLGGSTVATKPTSNPGKLTSDDFGADWLSAGDWKSPEV